MDNRAYTDFKAGEWAVDLTREEYLGYQQVLARAFGPLRNQKMQCILTFLVMGGAAAVTLYEWKTTGSLDWPLVLLSAALVVLMALWAFLLPLRLRRSAARSYDEAIAGGYSFYGTLRITPEHIQKECSGLLTSIPINETTMFIENPSLMLWINREQRAIVLPARCMTPEMAVAVRAAADRLPPTNRRFYGRLVPQGQPATPVTLTPPAVLWEQAVYYTPEEYTVLTRTMITRQYRARMPLYAMLAAAIALVLAFPDRTPIPCVIVFSLVLAVMTWLRLWNPISRIRRTAEDIPAETRSVRLQLTDRGITMKNENRDGLIGWGSVEHIIDRDTFVEIIRRQQLIHIPKRCIEDFEAFSQIIDAHWKTKSKT